MLMEMWQLQFFLPDSRSETITAGGKLNLLGFCLFEMCVGIFWPSIMKMRSQYIPEESRSTIMNFFRIPLNIFVCVVLYNVSFHSLNIPVLKSAPQALLSVDIILIIAGERFPHQCDVRNVRNLSSNGWRAAAAAFGCF